MKNRSATHRTCRWLLLCASLCAGACSWLESEFSTADRLPPSWLQAPDTPASATAATK